jgi:3-phenylpropionate/trans-cinnamate dioxygenase ferredoxin component
MGQFVRVAAVSDIPEGSLKAFDINYTRFVVAHTDEGFLAVADDCSHDGSPFARAHIRGGNIVCPRHGARFDLKTGAVTGPPAVAPIDTFRVKVEENDIYVYLD